MKNSCRLTAMERNQAETNKRLADANNRLADVMNSNLNLQSMLESVLSTISGKRVMDCDEMNRTGSAGVEEDTRNLKNPLTTGVGKLSGLESSEKWWNSLCKSSGEEDNEHTEVYNKDVRTSVSLLKVCLLDKYSIVSFKLCVISSRLWLWIFMKILTSLSE